MKLLNTKGVIDMLQLIKAGTVSTLRDERDNIIALNWVGNSTGIACAKYVRGHLTVGANEEERAADEAALRKFMEEWNNVDVLHVLNVALKLNKETLTDEDVAYLKNELQRYVDANKEVVTREVTRTAPAPRATAEYELDCLSIETLKVIRREATSKGDNALKNAARRALRHNGVNC